LSVGIEEVFLIDNDSLERSELVRTILTYCVMYPDAKDTVEGILEWWLPKPLASVGRDEIARILDALATLGWLIKRQLARSGAVYGVNKTALQEIITFLTAANER